ncbi:MAG TPA: LuxR C-terminal-related transcriptional regulator [Stellaceae bacterium]|nr:LuxR C-terminal-related transcriptional regulator [Stellaceae bacterium]
MRRGASTRDESWGRRRREIVRLAHAGHDLPTFLDETVRILREAIPCEAGCWHVLDPATLLETSYRAVNLPLENPLAAEIEYHHEDYNQFATLARAPRHSGILSSATCGVPERSLRYRALIRPLALEGELRAVFFGDGMAWGSVCLLREHTSGDFVPEEALLLDDVSAQVGRGIRMALLLRAVSARASEPDGPGLILLDERLRLETVTASAARLLEGLAGEAGEKPAKGELPYAVYAVAAKARLAGRAEGADAAAACAHLRTAGGGWLALHGCCLAGETQRGISVIIARAEPPSLAPAIGDAFGLTSREGEVMRHLLQGYSTKQIAAALHISPYTVQEHCTAIFDKAGVRSRRALVGKVFSQVYAPRLGEQLRPLD